MMLTLMLTSKGVAGVPRGALVVLTATLTQFGLPLEGAAILLGIDQILDMGRTAVNVMGNCIATAVVARWEGVFDDERMRAFAADAAARRPDADRGGRRARPARRRGRARVRGAHEVVRVRPRGARRHRRRGGAGGDRRASRPDVIVNCAGYNAVDARRGSSGRGAAASTPSPCGRWRGRRGAPARRSCTTAPTSCSTARPTRRTRKTDRAQSAQRLRARRSCSASGSRPTRRAAYVLRVESLFGARPAAPRQGQRRRRSSTALRPGGAPTVFEDRTVSPTYVVRRRARDARRCSSGGAPPGLYHCVNSGHVHLARVRARSGAAARRRAARSRPCGSPTSTLPARAAAVLRAVEREAARRSASRCRRGRTRSRAATSYDVQVRRRSADVTDRHDDARDDLATSSPTARHEVSPGESMPAAWTTRGVLADRGGSGNRRTTRSADAAWRGCRCPTAAGRRA